MNETIFIVEDNADILEYLVTLFSDNGYLVNSATTGTKALNTVEKINPNLVVLDLGLPDISGETVCQEMKKNYPELPIIILTARGTNEDVAHGLNIGADDYLAKPFDGQVLLARVKARLRNFNLSNEILKKDDLELNTKNLEVKRDGKQISLTPQEFKLLEYLLINKGRVVTREMILSRIWNNDYDVETRVVDVYIGYLRKKIDSGFPKKIIESARGFGYTIKN